MANVVQAWPADGVSVEVVGEGADHLPTAPRTRFTAPSRWCIAARRGAAARLRLRCENLIPPSRGLGSSSAARACGLLLGNRLLGDPLRRRSCSRSAPSLKATPTISQPACSAACRSVLPGRGGWSTCQVPVSFPLATTVYVPDFPMDTHAARGLLPTTVSIETAIYNISRASLFVAALATGRTDLLRTATEDAIHQPPRSRSSRRCRR